MFPRTQRPMIAGTGPDQRGNDTFSFSSRLIITQLSAWCCSEAALSRREQTCRVLEMRPLHQSAHCSPVPLRGRKSRCGTETHNDVHKTTAAQTLFSMSELFRGAICRHSVSLCTCISHFNSIFGQFCGEIEKIGRSEFGSSLARCTSFGTTLWSSSTIVIQ